jgi:hypothetical protein
MFFTFLILKFATSYKNKAQAKLKEKLKKQEEEK